MASVTETTQVAARVPDALVDRLQAIAAADDRSLSYIVRAALREYAERHENEAEDDAA